MFILKRDRTSQRPFGRYTPTFDYYADMPSSFERFDGLSRA
jgi:hypothetical protein